MTHSPPSSLEAASPDRTFADSMAVTDSPQCWHLITAIVPPEERRTTDQEPRALRRTDYAERCRRAPSRIVENRPPKPVSPGPWGGPGDGHVTLRQEFWRN